jgi:hypothetical protein
MRARGSFACRRRITRAKLLVDIFIVAVQFMEFLKTKELHPISILHGDEFLGLASLQAAVSILRSRTKAISESMAVGGSNGLGAEVGGLKFRSQRASRSGAKQLEIAGDTTVTPPLLGRTINCKKRLYYWRTRHDSNV